MTSAIHQTLIEFLQLSYKMQVWTSRQSRRHTVVSIESVSCSSGLDRRQDSPFPSTASKQLIKSKLYCDTTSHIRVDLGPNLRQLTQFRLFYDSITIYSPHALLFPLSQSLPLHPPCIYPGHDHVIMKEQG